MPRCVSCAEKIAANVEVCPYCNEVQNPKMARSNSSNNGRSSGGMSTGVMILIIGVAVFGVLIVCAGVMAALLLPAVQQAREAARRTQCKNNLKQIGLAMHNYHDTYMFFPAAHLNDEQDNPRISWRVSILPYLDASPRYNQYNMNAAWDSPQNASLINPLPLAYACPSHSVPGTINTSYAAITGENTALGDGKCSNIRLITDGTSNTLLVVEACHMNIPWMKPQDIDAKTVTNFGNPAGASSTHTGGLHVLMADGSVRFVSNNIDQGTIKKLITQNDGQTIGDF